MKIAQITGNNIYSLAVLFVTSAFPLFGQSVFQTDFSSGSITAQGNPYYGGWFSPQISTSAWYASSGTANISGGTLNVNSTSGTRSAGLFLPPSLFFGSGPYTLKFDVTSYGGDHNDNAYVSVWQGNAYDLFSSPNAVQLDNYSASLVPLGSASTAKLADGVFQNTGNDFTLNFNYDGSSGVALFFGAQTGGWPFPAVSYDNVRLSAVPEASTVTIFALLGTVSLLNRRRNAR